MRDNRKTIQLQLAQYRSLAEAGGVQAIEKVISQQGRPSRRRSFFVRVIAPGNKTVLLSNPRLWQEFDFMSFDDRQTEGQWQYFTSNRDTGLLEVTSARLSNNQVLQVGKSIQDREEILERFRDTLLATMIPMIMIGIGRRNVFGVSRFAADSRAYPYNAVNRRNRTDGSTCARKQ